MTEQHARQHTTDDEVVHEMPEAWEQPARGVELPDVEVRKPRGIPVLWIIPVVAALIGGWLAYQTYSSRGPMITVSFQTADGVEAGKTKLKYKDIELGHVETVDFSEDLSQVLVKARMDKEASSHLTAGTQFWVVRPRIGLSGISGLGTLVSGAYIEMAPGPGDKQTEFAGLETPPPTPPEVPGLRLKLHSATLGSISVGSPVYYRKIKVGQVEEHKLAEDRQSIEIDVFIKTPHDKLVSKSSRFWNASGIDLSMGADGIKVETDSLISLLEGGVAFDTPDIAHSPQPVENGARFTLYATHASVGEAGYTTKLPYVMYFDGSMRGLEKGAPVDFRGIKVGEVTDVRLELEGSQSDLRIPVTVEIEPQRVAGDDHPDPAAFIDDLVAQGMRAQLQSGSLLTGAKFVALDLHPDAAPAKVSHEGKFAELPTLPSGGLEGVENNVNQLLAEVRKMPLQKLVGNLADAAVGVNHLLNAKETQAMPGQIDQTLAEFRKLAGGVDEQIKPLAANFGKASKALRVTLGSINKLVNPSSPIVYDLANTLEESSMAAESIRVLANYLERHPDALVYGKGGK